MMMRRYYAAALRHLHAASPSAPYAAAIDDADSAIYAALPCYCYARAADIDIVDAMLFRWRSREFMAPLSYAYIRLPRC